jgi:hypothetical protein
VQRCAGAGVDDDVMSVFCGVRRRRRRVTFALARALFLLCCYCVCVDAHAAWRCAPLSSSIRAALVLAKKEKMDGRMQALPTLALPHAAAQRTAAAQLLCAADGVARHAG